MGTSHNERAAAPTELETFYTGLGSTDSPLLRSWIQELGLTLTIAFGVLSEQAFVGLVALGGEVFVLLFEEIVDAGEALLFGLGFCGPDQVFVTLFEVF